MKNQLCCFFSFHSTDSLNYQYKDSYYQVCASGLWDENCYKGTNYYDTTYSYGMDCFCNKPNCNTKKLIQNWILKNTGTMVNSY